MAENKILKNITSVYTDKSINGWLRGAIWVGTIVIVYIGGKAIYKKIFPSSEDLRIKEAQKQAEEDLQNSLKTKPLTYSITQYNQWAEQIVSAFSGCDYSDANIFWSNSAATVYDIFNNFKNDSDYLQLIKSFGTRTISKHIWCGGDYTNVDLPTAIGKQLSKNEIVGNLIGHQSINDLLKEKGINYQLTSL